MDSFRRLIRDVPDFPQPGILFRDITPLLAEPSALGQAVEALASPFLGRGIDRVVGIESRGFIFATPLAIRLGCGFAPVRKLGKLPGRTVAREYALEYGTNHLEMHVDAIAPGQRVLVVDDVLATGGTARAAIDLVRELGGELAGVAFLIELGPLSGRARLHPAEVVSLIRYD